MEIQVPPRLEVYFVIYERTQLLFFFLVQIILYFVCACVCVMIWIYITYEASNTMKFKGFLDSISFLVNVAILVLF